MPVFSSCAAREVAERIAAPPIIDASRRDIPDSRLRLKAAGKRDFPPGLTSNR